MIKSSNITLSLFTGFLLLSPIARAAAGVPSDAMTGSVCSADNLGAITASDIGGLTRAPGSAIPLPVPPLAAQPPLVITMPGLKFQAVSWGPIAYELFSEMAGYWYPALRNKDARSEAAMRAAFSEYNKRFDSLKDAAAQMPELNDTRAFPDDNYLEARLAQNPACAKFKVVPFPWSRNPSDTAATIDQYVPQLIKTYDENNGAGRPVYILAHSWGAIIMHDVLNQVAIKRPDIKIDKFLTLGSPLIPGNFIVNIFKNLQYNIAGLEKSVNKPANVRLWRNVWARHDIFSNAARTADVNVQVDASVGAPEVELTDVILYGYHKLDAKTDLIALLNIRSWHTCYYHDYDAFFKTINRHIHLVIFDPQVAAPLVARAAK